MPLSFRKVAAAIAIVAFGTAARRADAQSNPCSSANSLTGMVLTDLRRWSWPTDSIAALRRTAFGLTTLADSATADTAIVAVTDSATCRQALTVHNTQVPTANTVSAVYVIRYGTNYVVFDPAIDTDKRDGLFGSLLSAAFVLLKSFQL